MRVSREDWKAAEPLGRVPRRLDTSSGNECAEILIIFGLVATRFRIPSRNGCFTFHHHKFRYMLE